ncbi:polysaccharide biosynthesis protein [Methylococcaceae bacterium CS1]|nr:polysaccharide biosynthesis protein [Methyloprofundus sp.]TXK97864.1 polysaccharide biosynthesis protein [Methylococcaceae bacterium CS4]TXL00428.1 polysaccharide biosynthesis protein [Methylococcaceae bacterium CS5]TXL07536.1 polysaccharide biosynthesis protein [Methylococcaceae bacterium CS3]TXL08112.1 polysaccharide biosynthesis protein [Methylococcaceae bacterium CS1]TXL11269.1 polysaccharide biosynthesis protein [Methylococcaceae bacterium CS2]
MVACAWLLAFWIRFDLDLIPSEYLTNALRYLPYVIISQSIIFWYLGLYKGVWRFSSLPDLIRIFKAVFFGVFFIAGSLFVYNRLAFMPRSVLPLYTSFLLLFLSIPRLFYRYYKDWVKHEAAAQRALIIGAGAAGEMLARDLLQDEVSLLPIAFVDDDKAKKGRSIRGLQVFFDTNLVAEYTAKLNVDIILIAIPSASDIEMRGMIEACERAHVPFKTLPSVKELLSNTVSKGNLRNVAIDDILGREPVNLNWAQIKSSLSGKKILVTGGGGSIGSELCRQLAQVAPESIIIYEHSEFNLYQIHSTLRRSFPDLKLSAILGDVVDRAAVEDLIRNEKPEVIFHAAAYKHVPLLEQQVLAAVTNNLIGTKNVAEVALAEKVERFVLISTDKAVNPSNIMGATKRAAEILSQNLNTLAKHTSFITVRFGNVLDSAGSVVPLFREQIKMGGPVTVTHPDVSRFFMTIPEACRLIMNAEAVGAGGEIYVLDMGQAIKISYLAEQMIQLSGLSVGSDIKIEYIGLRAGEKLHEELFHEQEQLLGTGFEKLFLAKARRYEQDVWEKQMENLLVACKNRDSVDIQAQLKQLVPEFNNVDEQEY